MKFFYSFSNKLLFNFFMSVLLVALLLIVLTACGNKEDRVSKPKTVADIMQTASYKAPLSCNNDNIIQHINKTVQGAKVLPVDFKSGAGTTLEKILGLGGSICVVGMQEAGIGVQISYLNNASSFFKEQIMRWIADSYVLQDTGSLDQAYQEAEYFLNLESSKVNELHSASAQVLYKGIWVGINATYIYEKVDMDELVDVVLGEALVVEPISPRLGLVLPERLSSLVKVEDLLLGGSEDPQSIALLSKGAEAVYAVNTKKRAQSYYSNLATLILVSSKVYANSTEPELAFGKKLLDNGLWVLALEGPYVDNFNDTEVEALEIADLLLKDETFYIFNR